MSDTPDNTPAAVKPFNPLRSAFHFLTSLKLAVAILGISAVLVFLGTIAQVQEGLYLAQERWFKSWWIIRQDGDPWWVWFFPGGYTLGVLLIVNLVGAHLRRFKYPPGGLGVMVIHYLVVMASSYLITAYLLWTPLWFSLVFSAFLALDLALCDSSSGRISHSGKKIGVDLVHIGIVVLLIGQLATDMLAVETHLAFREGQTMRYSESRFDTELVVSRDLPGSPGKEEVVAIPQQMLADDNGDPVASEHLHAKLPFTVKVVAWQANSELVSLEKARESEGTLLQALATLDARYSQPENLVEEAKRAVEMPGRLPTWKLVLAEMGIKPVTDVVASVTEIQKDPARAADLASRVKKAFRSEMISRFKMQDADMHFAADHVERGESLSEKVFVPQATTEVAKRYRTVERKLMRDMESRNIPSAVVELKGTSGSLGTWLVSPHLKEQTIEYGGSEWRLALRIERTYYPFSMTLLKTTHEVYPGTDTPKDFRSRVLIENPVTSEKRETEIFMNAPLRYEGLTFFQYQMGKDEVDRSRGTSSLQVVKNPGWFSPYYGCALVGYGMLRHFLLHLFRFIRKRTQS